MYQIPSHKPDIFKNILQNVLRKHIHVTSLTDNIQTNIKVIINTNREELPVEKHNKEGQVLRPKSVFTMW